MMVPVVLLMTALGDLPMMGLEVHVITVQVVLVMGGLVELQIKAPEVLCTMARAENVMLGQEGQHMVVLVALATTDLAGRAIVVLGERVNNALDCVVFVATEC